MYLKQFVDETLGNSILFDRLGNDRLAAVIDSTACVDSLSSSGRRSGAAIDLRADTHLHNDFISGAHELLARETSFVGASAEARLEFEYQPLRGGATLSLGD